MTSENNHSRRLHALLAPSSAKRWIACPGSVALGIDIPDPEPSEAALEGTKLHECAEHLSKMHDLQMQYELLKLASVDEESATLIAGYLEFCDKLGKAFTKDFEQVISDTDPSYRYADEHQFHRYIEKKFQLTENIWGTVDHALVGKRNGLMEVDVVDLKTGGQPVEAVDNPQLIIYGLGICKELGIIPDKLRLYIYQPRGGGETVKRAVLNQKEIDLWSNSIRYAEATVLNVLSLESVNKDAIIQKHLNPGDHCRWCKCAPTCPALHKQSTELIQPIEERGLSTFTSMPIEKLAELYKKKEMIENLLEAVQNYIVKAMEAGIDVPGLKLVTSRGKRSWGTKDKALLADILMHRGVPENLIYKKSIINLGDAEKLLGKGSIDDLVSVPVDRHIAVPIEDKRIESNNLKLIEAIEND